MFMTPYISLAVVIASISILWRIFRYDTENPINGYLDRWPYLPKKLITCGVCFTFWITLVFVLYSQYRNNIPFSTESIFLDWMTTGFYAVMLVYVFDTFYQISHYFKHKAEQGHTHE